MTAKTINETLLIQQLAMVMAGDDYYKRLDYDLVERITPDGVMIDSRWLPKSEMRVDGNGVLYLAGWLHRKHFGG